MKAKYCRNCKTMEYRDDQGLLVERCLCDTPASRSLLILAPGWADPGLIAWRWKRFVETEMPNWDLEVLKYPNNATVGKLSLIAKRQSRYLEEIAAKYHKVAIVGHSMGGLLARAIEAKGRVRVNKLVTIATPNRGTILAKGPLAIFSKTVAQMDPDSKFLSQLPPAPSCETMTISAHFDPLLFPASSSTLPGVEDLKVTGTEHLSVALVPRTLWEIYSFLEF